MSLDKPTPNFNMRDLLNEIAEIDQDVNLGEKLTTRDFKSILGLGSMSATRKRIRPLVQAGVLIPIKVTRKNMAGVDSHIPAYAVSPTATWEDVEKLLKNT